MAETYSFADLTGGISSAIGPYVFGGKTQGKGQIVVNMATEKTSSSVSADGTTMISFIPGDSGTVTVECQQNSEIDRFFLHLLNHLKGAAANGDVSEWASMAMTLRSIVGRKSHICNGGALQNYPSRTYAAQGGMITWTILFADIQNPTA